MATTTDDASGPSIYAADDDAADTFGETWAESILEKSAAPPSFWKQVRERLAFAVERAADSIFCFGLNVAARLRGERSC